VEIPEARALSSVQQTKYTMLVSIASITTILICLNTFIASPPVAAAHKTWHPVAAPADFNMFVVPTSYMMYQVDRSHLFQYESVFSWKWMPSWVSQLHTEQLGFNFLNPDILVTDPQTINLR